jgi:hypothetical protein
MSCPPTCPSQTWAGEGAEKETLAEADRNSTFKDQALAEAGHWWLVIGHRGWQLIVGPSAAALSLSKGLNGRRMARPGIGFLPQNTANTKKKNNRSCFPPKSLWLGLCALCVLSCKKGLRAFVLNESLSRLNKPKALSLPALSLLKGRWAKGDYSEFEISTVASSAIFFAHSGQAPWVKVASRCLLR